MACFVHIPSTVIKGGSGVRVRACVRESVALGAPCQGNASRLLRHDAGTRRADESPTFLLVTLIASAILIFLCITCLFYTHIKENKLYSQKKK